MSTLVLTGGVLRRERNVERDDGEDMSWIWMMMMMSGRKVLGGMRTRMRASLRCDGSKVDSRSIVDVCHPVFFNPPS